MTNKNTSAPGAGYAIGDTDARSWGSYTVVAVGKNDGEEYCEKEIIINPGRILPLQSHEHRRERWMVKQGVLTVVLDGKRIEVKKGDEVRIPLRAVHCMANLGKDACIVREIQAGVCREEDVALYGDADAQGLAGSSLAVYQQLLAEIKKKA